MNILSCKDLTPRWVGRYRLEGEKKYITFDVPADNEDSVRSRIESNHPGETVTEFRTHKLG